MHDMYKTHGTKNSIKPQKIGNQFLSPHSLETCITYLKTYQEPGNFLMYSRFDFNLNQIAEDVIEFRIASHLGRNMTLNALGTLRHQPDNTTLVDFIVQWSPISQVLRILFSGAWLLMVTVFFLQASESWEFLFGLAFVLLTFAYRWFFGIRAKESFREKIVTILT